jgi:hypothetical protein
MYYIGEDGSYILSFDSSASTTEICLEFRAAVNDQEELHQVYLNEHPNLPLDFFQGMSIMAQFHSVAILAEFQNMYYLNAATYDWENENDLMIFTYLRYQQLIGPIGNPDMPLVQTIHRRHIRGNRRQERWSSYDCRH